MKKKIGLLIILLLCLTLGCTQTEEKEQHTKKEYTGIFQEYYAQAEETVKNMTLEEKVGQVFLVRYNVSDVEYWNDYYPGGYILFARDFQNHKKDSITEEIKHDQEISKYPLIIGVDEEGGNVTRVSRYIAYRDTKFKSPRAYYEEGGYELLEQIEKEKAELLLSLGVNLNLAPVVDISTSEEDFIYDRAFGKGTEETTEFARNMVKYANENHINSCLKHFPGYGNNLDTHTDIAIDERSYENFLENDFKPFQAGIEEKVPSILVAHNIVKCIDSEYPASLSKKVNKELRNTLGFTGIIMTDDLAMDAVKSYVDDGKAATQAMNAGNDMIITSDFVAMRDELLKSIETGELKEETINEAVTKVIAWKYSRKKKKK